jgi:hypothetical protein
MSEPLERTPSAFRLNLEQQKKRARELLNAAKAGDTEALAKLARAHGRHIDAPKLVDAQFAIARELRFASWARLKAHIAAMDRQWTAITDHGAAPDAGMRTLHLRCGHDIQNTLSEAGFVGDFHAHITPYCQGPVTAGPDRHERMARFIVDSFDAIGGGRGYSFRVDIAGDGAGVGPVDTPTYEQILAAERRQEEVLARMADEYERVVIWMEHDSWDQLILVRLLAHFATARRPRVLELIAVDEYPGATRFLGVGQLPHEALRLLWETRRPVTPAQLALGAEAWQALTSPDPTPLAALAASGTPALPILAPALHRHLRELPAIHTGLGLTEELILRIIADEGTTTLGRVFWILQNGREPLPYLGDSGVAYIVCEMERASESPLVRAEGAPGERIFANRLTLTDAGRAVLNGRRDWHELAPRPRWVGGVHVRPGEPGWRWDEASRTPVRSAR